MKILFIINPIAGTKKNIKDLENLIGKTINKNKFELIVKYTEYAFHGTEIAEQAVKDKIDIVVAVGGDGTINEISKSLVNTNTIMAIIPKGSGNGLARYLKIPMNTKRAIKLINKLNIKKIDTAKINNKHFINVAGVGFDAHISYLFANYGKRGFLSYVKLILREFKKYKAETYTITANNKEQIEDAFLISFANSSQFGNEAHIAPLAQINDGLIDIVVLKKFPLSQSMQIASKLYTKTLHKSKYYQLIQTNKAEVICKTDIKGHIDGEPTLFEKTIKLEIIKESLKILVN